ncbi:NAD(P)/FAD-dependent oxidoreductase [Streptomyces rubrolavendulae]|uniref:6-hydroxy-3-succinoylpyridine 3-monooxygenase HspB n=1 Tax=Streptomyces rubrolavendulae TaxID=285473 RepID=A0A1D8G1V4_9ACTN|nr:NAD(P)/FAD-dependent oxidoreductase [Streptomyces rubrolavendulae]AOT59432.1 6-hydroxy-3-succinoylpyridine 3-monooxygenase HspB [Streptomyces rubrolavendulae]
MIRPYYDVVIMGGGPGGSSLAALLMKQGGLSVAVFEKEEFPREHIGESFAHPLIPVLEETGVLDKVMASDCWVKKFGGIFQWRGRDPHVAFFDHANTVRDGAHRWAIHVNRSEFDKILLDHAAELGAEVFEGTSVAACTPLPDGSGREVVLKDGRTVRAGFFVDASGRRNSIVTGKRREWLSGYRNIAIWQHYLGGRPAQTLEGDWNVFREGDMSPIGCFAFRDGWCWYIPVPKVLDGKRVTTHSIGIVTDPNILKQPGTDFTDPEVFLRTVKEVPKLRELIGDVTPIDDKMLTATNYSMINDLFADYDGRWILLGDASYFVDPLFSSGVAFATNQARAAAALIRETRRGEHTEDEVRGLWRDYDTEWHGMAASFALSIDQWYHAIGKDNPESVYWNSRGTDGLSAPDHEATFHALLNTAFTPDLLQVLTRGEGLAALDVDGPFMTAYAEANDLRLDADTKVALKEGVTASRGPALDIPGFKAAIPPDPDLMPAAEQKAVAAYWADPVRNGDLVESPLARTLPAHRFRFADDPEGAQVRGLDERDGAAALWERLRGGPVLWRDLVAGLDEGAQRLLKRLLHAGMLDLGAHA